MTMRPTLVVRVDRSAPITETRRSRPDRPGFRARWPLSAGSASRNGDIGAAGPAVTKRVSCSGGKPFGAHIEDHGRGEGPKVTNIFARWRPATHTACDDENRPMRFDERRSRQPCTAISLAACFTSLEHIIVVRVANHRGVRPRS